MHRYFATMCSIESHSFYQNAQKLTGNTKNMHILNSVIGCLCLVAGKIAT